MSLAALPIENPATLAHLNMMQSIISRLAGNSAQCKTWCLTLVTALIAFTGASHSVTPIRLTILPLAMFFILDAAYLGVEREYRKLFEDIVDRIKSGTYAGDYIFKLKKSITPDGFFSALGSWSIFLYYYPLFAAYAVVVYFLSDLAAILASPT